MDAVLDSMFEALRCGNEVYLPSKYWEVLNRRNLDQLDAGGDDDFKRTVALNYFTWIVGRRDDQFRNILRRTRVRDWPAILAGSWGGEVPPGFSRKRYAEFRIFARMLWKLALRKDSEGLLRDLEEPAAGNPFPVRMGGKRISQDLANSVLEYYSVREGFTVPRDREVTACELGAGYGRNAYVFLSAFPRCRYVVVDIPPALYLSQRYLSKVFPERKVFGFRPFDDYRKVEQELAGADIAFLLPHQLEALPDKTFDLFLNISSLHEMRMDQIHAYFRLIDRLTRGFFYTKQWQVSRIPYEDIIITQDDYPVPKRWKRLYHRPAEVQTAFFEAMYALG